MTKMLLEESSKQALQAALADLLLATASELKERKHPGWAYTVFIPKIGRSHHQRYIHFLMMVILVIKATTSPW